MDDHDLESQASQADDISSPDLDILSKPTRTTLQRVLISAEKSGPLTYSRMKRVLADKMEEVMDVDGCSYDISVLPDNVPISGDDGNLTNDTAMNIFECMLCVAVVLAKLQVERQKVYERQLATIEARLSNLQAANQTVVPEVVMHQARPLAELVLNGKRANEYWAGLDSIPDPFRLAFAVFLAVSWSCVFINLAANAANTRFAQRAQTESAAAFADIVAQHNNATGRLQNDVLLKVQLATASVFASTIDATFHAVNGSVGNTSLLEAVLNHSANTAAQRRQQNMGTIQNDTQSLLVKFFGVPGNVSQSQSWYRPTTTTSTTWGSLPSLLDFRGRLMQSVDVTLWSLSRDHWNEPTLKGSNGEVSKSPCLLRTVSDDYCATRNLIAAFSTSLGEVVSFSSVPPDNQCFQDTLTFDKVFMRPFSENSTSDFPFSFQAIRSGVTLVKAVGSDPLVAVAAVSSVCSMGYEIAVRGLEASSAAAAGVSTVICVTIAVALFLVLYVVRWSNDQRTYYSLTENDRTQLERFALHRIPESIAQKGGGGLHAPFLNRLENLVFISCDLAGSLTVAEASIPAYIRLLGYTFFALDVVARHFDVAKVRTIGDGIFLVGGLPSADRDENTEPEEDVDTEPLNSAMAFCCVVQMLGSAYFRHFPSRHSDLKPLDAADTFFLLPLRIGVHSGSGLVGVVDTKSSAPSWDCFGANVGITRRLEELCPPGRILASQMMRRQIQSADRRRRFEFESSVKKLIKGYGTMSTSLVKSTKIRVGKSLIDQLCSDIAIRRRFFSNTGWRDQGVHEDESVTSHSIMGESVVSASDLGNDDDLRSAMSLGDANVSEPLPPNLLELGIV